jgi:hypothetical protein
MRLAPSLAPLLLMPLLAATPRAPLAAQGLVGRADSIYTWRGPLRTGARLEILNHNGPIDVRQSSGTAVELRAEKRPGRGGGELSDVAFHVSTAANGDVTICSTFGDRDPCERDDRRNDDGGWRRDVTVAMTVLVPRGTELRVATGNGALSIDRVNGILQASTGNGRVLVTGTEGSARVATGNGDVEVRDAGGPVRATTGNGRVSVVTAAGPVEAHSGNGDIDVRISALRSRDDMSFTTGSGSVHLTLPPSYSGELEASTGNGEVQSDFELKVHGRLDPRRLRATIGDGGPLLRLSSGNGALEVRKGR